MSRAERDRVPNIHAKKHPIMNYEGRTWRRKEDGGGGLIILELLEFYFAGALCKSAGFDLGADFVGEVETGGDVVDDGDGGGFVGGEEFDVLEAEEAQGEGLDDAHVFDAVELEGIGGAGEEAVAGEEALGGELELLGADGEAAAEAVDEGDADETDAGGPELDDEGGEEDGEGGERGEEEREEVF
jgi:hypothetical protein